MATQPRHALLAGASGLIGRASLPLLLDSPRYGRVHALLRRQTTDLPAHPKLQLHVVDFGALPTLPPLDDVFIALGTTIKQSGSQDAFRRVDFDAVLATARAGRTAGAKRLLVVSALGADAKSRVFYNRVKGEMQRAVIGLGYESVIIVQPSLLLGDRAAIGQEIRPGETRAVDLLRPVLNFVPRSVRPTAADLVAQSMFKAALEATSGILVLRSGEMQA